jgi:DNA polymerase/3'-5' exonuclease PolX
MKNEMKKSLDVADSQSQTYIKLAYKRAIDAIRNNKEDQLTPKMKEKVEYYRKNNTVENKANTDNNNSNNTNNTNNTNDNIDDTIIDELTTINGIGRVLAKKLIKKSITSKEDLKAPKIFDTLPYAAQCDILHNPIKIIPRVSIEKLENSFREHKINVVFVGSYRRQLPTSKDIDVICILEGKNKENVLDKIKENYNVIIYSQGDDKVSLLIFLDDIKRYAKMDIFYVIKDDYPAMLLYATGSKDFNIKMRRLYKRKKLLLNQHGVYSNGVKIKPQPKIEEDFFKLISLKYLEPKDRI